MAEDRDPPAPVPGQRAIASLIPFGIGAEQPHLLRDLAAGVWENRDNLSFAWNLLNTGVCDGCALGPRGLRDEVLPGVHLCARRLRDLRRQTMPALAPADLLDIDRLRHMDRESLENLGRISYPYVYRPGDRGFSRLSWTEALDVVRERCAGIPPDRMGFLAAGRGLTNEAYFALSKTARLLGSNHIDLCSDAGPSNGLAEALGEDTATCSLSDLIGTDLLLVIGTRLVADQPVAAKYLAEAKARGTRIVVVAPSLDPGLDRTWEPSSARTAVFGARLVDDFIRVEDGGAPAFLTGVLKALQARGGENTAFIQASTSGWEALAAELRGLPWSAL